MSIFSNAWNVLLVDDEPDVLSVSKLAMQNFEVNGQPLNLLTADSKAAAIDLFKKETKWVSMMAVAFIDVVMETDTAGVELCQYIREDLKNRVTQLYIRTGQPGIAPERTVIDRYDINGYFTKAEATEDKLYSLVKSGVRQFVAMRQMAGMMQAIGALITAGDSRAKLSQVFERIFAGFTAHDHNEPGGSSYYVAVDGQPVVESDFFLAREDAMAIKDKLDKLEGIPLGPDGDHYIIDEHNNVLINIVAKPHQPAGFLLFKETPFGMPESTATSLHFAINSLTTLWSRAA